tara:strand:- start:538 stop:693 length:156 start_codon:yes stop_codon:yes gene_type:complete
MKYKIIRFFQDERESQTIKRGLTLEEAQKHCQDPKTSGEGWFDGYGEEISK